MITLITRILNLNKIGSACAGADSTAMHNRDLAARTIVNEDIKPMVEHCKWTLNQFLYFNLDILQNIKAIKIVSS